MAKLKLKDVRLAFPNLWTATAPRNSAAGTKKAFSASFLFPPNHPQIAEITGTIKTAAVEQWGPKADAILKALKAADKICLHNGDAKEDCDGYAGNLFISARSYVRPSVFDQQKNPVGEDQGLIYSGCRVNAVLEIWAQENEFGKRINARLGGVQFLRDDDAFAGGKAADAEDFDEIGVEGETAAADEEVDLTA